MWETSGMENANTLLIIPGAVPERDPMCPFVAIRRDLPLCELLLLLRQCLSCKFLAYRAAFASPDNGRRGYIVSGLMCPSVLSCEVTWQALQKG